MQKLTAFLLATLAAACFVAAPPASAQTTLTMSSWVGPTHHLTSVVLQGWANEVEKATGGRVKLQMLPKHPSAPPGTFDAVKDGLVDVSYVTASYTPARHILPLMPELPGSGDTALVNSVAYSRIHWKYFQQVGEYKGVKLLGVFTHGPGQMYTKKTVRGIDDMQGLKIRTGGGVAEAVANALGASAFVKPAPESFELLKSGVADGVFFPLESIVSFKLETVLEQATLFPGGMYSSAFGFFMNEDKWDKLSKQDQDAIEKVSGEHLARHGRPVLGRRRQARHGRHAEGRHQDRQRRPRLRRRGAEALGADHRGLDQEGERQGRGRGQDPRRVPRRAEEGRRRSVSELRRSARKRRADAILGGAASADPPGHDAASPSWTSWRRYVFNRPLRGAFEITELMLVVLIFAGLPLVSYADEHAVMDFIDRLLGPGAQRALWRAVQVACAAFMFLLAWLVWLKADRIWAYRDATDVLRIVYGPFVYFMAAMIALAGALHLYKAAGRR